MAMTAADKQRMKEIKERYPFDMKAFVKSAKNIHVAENKENDSIAVTDGYKGFLCNNIQQTLSDMAFIQGCDLFYRDKIEYDKFKKMLMDAAQTDLCMSDMHLTKGRDTLSIFYAKNVLVCVNSEYADMIQDCDAVYGVGGTSPIVAVYDVPGVFFLVLPVRWLRTRQQYDAVCKYHGVDC